MPAAQSAIRNPQSPIPPLRLAVLISGSGRTLENIQHTILAGDLHAKITLVISSRANVYGLERAANLGLPSAIVARKTFNSPSEFSDVIWKQIREAGADYVCLAGFLSLITIPPDFAGRVINVHPGLLPSFGGKGMYGHHVHEAVIAAGCKLSGCSVHFADETYDTGPILMQRACDVLDDDTPDTLAARVFEEETKAYPEALKLIAQGRVILKGQRARIVPAIPDMVARAKRFSEIAHDGQLRKDGQPYATHPAAVVGLLREHGMSDADVITAGYLHDTIEDCGITQDQLARAFNPRVAAIVQELTIPPEDSEKERKAAYLVSHAPMLSVEARWVKLADRAHNLSELKSRTPERRVSYARESFELAEALKPWPCGGLGKLILERAATFTMKA
ncbi:MAG: phosphoribosylglycinamide formyltransferase [Phycisphaeraceae bacterium]